MLPTDDSLLRVAPATFCPFNQPHRKSLAAVVIVAGVVAEIERDRSDAVVDTAQAYGARMVVCA